MKQSKHSKKTRLVTREECHCRIFLLQQEKTLRVMYVMGGGGGGGTPWGCGQASFGKPVVFKVCAFFCHSAVDVIDDTDSNGVAQSGYQPEEVGAVSCK